MGDELDQLLMRQVARCREEAVRSGGQVSSEQVEYLSRLSKLAEICRSVRHPVLAGRWITAVIFGISLAIASFLLFARVTETDIELDLDVSEVSFSLAGQQVLSERIVLPVLGVSGLRQIQIPPSRTQEGQSWVQSDRPELSVRLTAGSIKQRHGTITLGPLQLAGNTRVGVRLMGPSGQYRVSLKGEELELGIDVNGPMRFERSDGPPAQFDFDSPSTLLLQPVPYGIDLDLVFSDSSQAILSSQLPVRDLSVMHIQEFRSSNSPTVRRLSSVLSGRLYLESLNGEEYKLRAGEALQFDRSDGEIRIFQLGNDKIAFTFEGRVRGMATGSGEGRHSLMPTWLEWLRARHGLSLLWGTAVYLFGLSAGAIRAWRASS